MVAPYTGISYYQKPPEIPINKLREARKLLASHISKDGLIVYRFKMGTWEYCEWDGCSYKDSWWMIEKLPEGLVRL